MTPSQQALATKLRALADEAWDSGEKELSTKLHYVASQFESPDKYPPFLSPEWTAQVSDQFLKLLFKTP